MGRGGDDRHGFQVSLTAPGEPWRRGRLSWGASGRGPGCLSLRCCQSPRAGKPSCFLVLHREECTAGEGDLGLRVLLAYLFSHSRPVASSVKGDDNVLLQLTVSGQDEMMRMKRWAHGWNRMAAFYCVPGGKKPKPTGSETASNTLFHRPG